MDVKVPGGFSSLLDQPTVVRRGESHLHRVLIQIWAPLVHVVLSLMTATVLVFYLDTRHVQAAKRVRWSEILSEPSLCASDVTTLVSAALLLIRLVGQVFVFSLVWRCTAILLQHDGLSLGQLDAMLSYRVPIVLSGKYSIPTAMALVMMLPSAFISPILSGSVNWEGAIYRSNLSAGFGSSARSAHFWQRFQSGSRAVCLEVVRNALTHATVLWGNIRPEDRLHSPKYRYVPRDDAAVGTIVERVPMPYITVESLTWDEELLPGIDYNLTAGPHLYGDTRDGSAVAIGSTMLFRPTVQQLPHQVLPNNVLYAGQEWKIAVVVGNNVTYIAATGAEDFSCSTHGWSLWDPVDSAITLLEPFPAACWAVGTIKLTAGVRIFQRGLYVTNRTVEAIEQGGPLVDPSLSPDPWAEYSVFMLTDLIYQYARIRDPQMRGGDLTSYTEEIVRQAYIAMRQALPWENAHAQQRLVSLSPTSLLEAKVDSIRVWVWLALSMLLPASWLVVLGMEMSSKRNMRAPVLSTALIPILTDVRDLLVKDDNGLSNMSYLTGEDMRGCTKIKLEIQHTGSGGPPVYGLRRIETGEEREQEEKGRCSEWDTDESNDGEKLQW